MREGILLSINGQRRSTNININNICLEHSNQVKFHHLDRHLTVKSAIQVISVHNARRNREHPAAMTQPTPKDAHNTLSLQQQEQPPALTSVAEKTLPSKCKDGSLLAYCPTMDLIALATEDEQLYVYRLNGQEVLSADLAGDPYLDEVKGEIRGVRWKNDGNEFPLFGA